MRRLSTIAAILFMTGGRALAQQTDLTLGVASAIVDRGVALGHSSPAVQATASYYSPQQWFASVSGASLGAPWRRSPVQLHGTLGYVLRLSEDWGAQFGYAYYGYPFDGSLRRYEHDELGATLAFRDIAFFSITGLHGSRSTPYGDTDGVAFDLVLRYPLRPGFAAVFGAGHEHLRNPDSFGYVYGQVGLSARIGSAQAELLYIATDASAKAWFGAEAADRFAASVTWSF